MSTWQLKYLFEAVMKDGSRYMQTPEDVSLVDPTRSAFYDVAQRLDDVCFFGLYNDEHTYVVSLEDGHFEVDGVPFSAQPSATPTIVPGGTFKLLYFRDHQHHFVGDQEVAHDVQYRFGWEYHEPTPSERVHVQTLVVA